MKKYRENHKEHLKKLLHEYYLKNKERLAGEHKTYRKQHKQEIKDYFDAWRKNNQKKFNSLMNDGFYRNKERWLARNQAVKKIKIPSGQKCEICQKNFAIQRHHKDYNNPLDVTFLCRNCHNSSLYKFINSKNIIGASV